MALLNLRIEPSGSGFYVLPELMINLEWVQVDTDDLPNYALANVIKAIEEGVLETDIPLTGVLSQLIPGFTIPEIHEEVYYAEKTNRCTLGDMIFTPPIVNFPVNNTDVLTPIVHCTVGNMTVGQAFIGEHTHTNWQISDDPYFFRIVDFSYEELGRKLSFDTRPLVYGDTYYLRAQYGSGYMLSRWSETVMFTISAEGINTPTIDSPITGNIDTPVYLRIQASAYDPIGVAEAHLSSDWEVSSDSLFSTIVWSSMVDTVNLTDIQVAPNLLPLTQYYVRVKYNATTYSSAYSNTIPFVTNYGHKSGLWSIASSRNLVANSVTTDSLNNIYIAGTSTHDTTGEVHGIIIKLDQNHTIITVKEITLDQGVALNGIAISSTDVIYVCGYHQDSTGVRRGLLMRFDATLTNHISGRIEGSNVSEFQGITLTSDDSVVTCGSYASDCFICRWQSGMLLADQRVLSGTNEGTLYSVSEGPGGSLVTVGYERHSAFQKRGYIAKFDSTLGLLAQKSITLPNHGILHSVTTDSSGNFVCVGRSWNNGYVISVDITMSVVYEKLVTGASTDVLKSISRDQDGSLYMSGVQSSDPGGSSRGYLSKMDSNFNENYQLSVGGIGQDDLRSVSSKTSGQVVSCGIDGSTAAMQAIQLVVMSNRMSHSDISEIPDIVIQDSSLRNVDAPSAYSNALLITSNPARAILTDPMTVTASAVTIAGNYFH